MGIMKSGEDTGEILKQYTAKRDKGPVGVPDGQFSSPSQLANSKLIYQRVSDDLCL